MILAKVEGSVVATMKDVHVAGRKLLLVRPQFVEDRNRTRFRAGGDTFVAVDTVGAAKCKSSLEQSPALCTALAPVIGYDRAAKIGLLALETGRTVLGLSKPGVKSKHSM